MLSTLLPYVKTELLSDSEEEIDVVNVADLPVTKHLIVTLPAKQKYGHEEVKKRKPRLQDVGCKSFGYKARKSRNKCDILKDKISYPAEEHNYSLSSQQYLFSTSLDSQKSAKKLKRNRKRPFKSASHIHVKHCFPFIQRSGKSRFTIREQHNTLERKRRQDLHNCFCNLKDCIPQLVGYEKAPKITILRQAYFCIHRIIEVDRRFETELKQLKVKKKKLENLLAKLRKQCGMNMALQ